MKTESSLLYAVLAKTFLEIALLCVAASVATFASFHPGVRGAIDVVDGGQVAGWAYDPDTPLTPVEVQLFIDGRFYAAQTADRPRPDLVRAGATVKPTHGFEFPLSSFLPARGRHTVEVFVRRMALGGHQTLIPLTNREKSFWLER